MTTRRIRGARKGAGWISGVRLEPEPASAVRWRPIARTRRAEPTDHVPTRRRRLVLTSGGCLMDRGSTTNTGRGGASERREYSPLPALAGFEFIADDIATHDGSLSTFR